MNYDVININNNNYFKQHYDFVLDKLSSKSFRNSVLFSRKLHKALFFIALGFLITSLHFLFGYIVIDEQYKIIDLIIVISLSASALLIFIVWVILVLRDYFKMKKNINTYFEEALSKKIIMLPTTEQCTSYIKRTLLKKNDEKFYNAVKTLKKQIDTGVYDEICSNKNLIDNMDGVEFEDFCVKLLAKLNYSKIQKTKASGDQGVDIICSDGKEYMAIQCKRYAGSLGNGPVQEVFAGSKYYGATQCCVFTNSHFTSGAIELANRIGVMLIDGEGLMKLVKTANEGSMRREKAYNELTAKALEEKKKTEQTINNMSEQDLIKTFINNSSLVIKGNTLGQVNNYTRKIQN